MARQLILMTLLGVVTLARAQTDRMLIREGNNMFHKQDYAKAETLYRKAISKNSSNPQAMYNLGCALMMQNKDSAAVLQYQNATKLEKNKFRLAAAYHNIGVVCQNHKMYDDAIKAYEQALRNNPKDDETRYNLALCKRLRKDKDNNNDKNNKDENKNDDKKEQDNKEKDNKQQKEDNKQQVKPNEQMSRENAEQLLNAAMQNEKATQQRLNKAMQKPSGPRRLQKNW